MQQGRGETCNGSGFMYEINVTHRIGSGGNGEILKGLLGKDKTECVVKRVSGNSKASYMQLMNEGRVLKYLCDAGFVDAPCYFCEKDGALVMGFVPGRTIGAMDIRQMSEKELRSLFVDITSLIVRLHGLNPPVIHRDIKPSNIMIDDRGRLYLIDFGTAEILDDFSVENKRKGKSLPAGTKSYAAPEQYGGLGSESYQVDIYQRGKTMERLLGKAIVSKRFAGEMKGIVDRCCMPNCAERYLSAYDIRKDLMSISVRKNNFPIKIFNKKFMGKFHYKDGKCKENNEVFIDIVRTYDTIEFL